MSLKYTHYDIPCVSDFHLYSLRLSDEHVVSVQIGILFLQTLLRIIVLQRVEEHLLPLIEVMLSVVFLCAEI